MPILTSSKGKKFELDVTVLGEYGYQWAMLGLSYNKKQPLENMPNVALKLAFKDGGHNKFLEQIVIWMEVKAPRFLWQEMDTYRLSSKSSESTMHTILNDELLPGNFEAHRVNMQYLTYLNVLLRNNELEELKGALPEGFLQKRMWMMSYKCMRNLILQRRRHRLPHWAYFIDNVLSELSHPELLPSMDKGK